MSYATERAAASRTPQDIVILGVRQCANWYAQTVDQETNFTESLDNLTYHSKAAGTTITANATAAPDDATTAELLAFAAGGDYVQTLLEDGVAASHAFTASIFLKGSSAGTMTLKLTDSTASETTTQAVNVTTSWQRFSLHRLYTGGATGAPRLRIERVGGDLASVYAWGHNVSRNPGDVNRVVLYPYRKRELTVIDNTVRVSYCQAADAGDGNRCFYTPSTCQDQANFNPGNTYEATPALKGIKEYRFCRGAAALPLGGDDIRPLLKSYDVTRQRIDPVKSITESERVNLEFSEYSPPGLWNPDKSSDGALVNTAAPGAGTFWRRWLLIHRHYANPEAYAIVKSGFVASGFTESDYEHRHRLLMRNLSISVSGRVTLDCIDRLRMTRVKAPPQLSSTNLLDGTINNSVTALSVDRPEEITDPGSGYTVTIKIDNEKLNVTAKTLGGNPLTVQRGRWGTAAASHTDNTAVSEIVEFGTERTTPSQTPLGKNGIDIVIELLKRSGIAAADIDTATLESERDTWMPSTIDATAGVETGTTFRRTLTDTTEISKLLTELREVMMLYLWVNENNLVTGRLFAPARPTETLAVLTDNETFVKDSLSLNDNDESRLTEILVAWDPIAGEAGDAPSHYLQHRYRIDVEAEGRSGYGDERLRTILSKWIRTGDTTTPDRLTIRLLGRFRNGARSLSFGAELKDEFVKLGDTVQVSTSLIQTQSGAAQQGRMMQIMSKRRSTISRFDYEAIDTGLFRRYGFIAPAGQPDYPSATVNQRRYGYVGTAINNQVGTPKEQGYYIW